MLAALAAVPFLSDKGQLEQPVTITIPFSSGVSVENNAKTFVAQAAKEGLVRPGATIVVSGHSGSRGDQQANIDLSRQRAESIAAMLVQQGLDPDQIETVGVGDAEPLPKKDDESDRSYQRRLSRADVVITP